MPRPHANPRQLLLLFCMLAAVFLVARCSYGDAGDKHKRLHEKPKQRILDLEQEWRNDTLMGDTTDLDHLLSDDYVGISWNGQISTKAMLLDRMRTHSLSFSQMDMSDVKIKVINKVGIVTATVSVDGTNDGTAVHGTFRYTRIYQRQPSGAWKVTNFEATRAPGAGLHNASSTSKPSQ